MPTPKPKTEEWEKEFNRRFGAIWNRQSDALLNFGIKSFIRQLLSTVRAEAEKWGYEKGSKNQLEVDIKMGVKEGVKDNIRQSERAKFSKILAGLKMERMENPDEAWNKLCALSMNDSGLAEGSMALRNELVEEINKKIDREIEKLE